MRNFQKDAALLPRQQIPLKPSPRQPKTVLLASNEHQTLTQSAGIIFTSGSGSDDDEEEVTSPNDAPSVQSELLIPLAGGRERVLRTSSAPNVVAWGNGTIRAASGYLRGMAGVLEEVEGEEEEEEEKGEGEGEGSRDNLPTAKELIEMRQKKKVS